MNHHHLAAGPATAQWGFLDASCKPVLHVEDGDAVTVETVSGSPGFVPSGDMFHVPQALRNIHESVVQGPGPHILTGPIHIASARPGDVLEVEILDIRLAQNWGLNISRPLAGALPYDFERPHATLIPLDLDRKVGRLPWGLELPLSPFFGIMAVAPPPAWGRVSSIMPRAFGGNLDNKDLIAGAKLFLPVFVDGALFTCGDGHGAQGDGEVNVNAIETALTGTFRFTVRKDLSFRYPRAETASHYITMGMDPDLDQCAVIALRDMIRLLGEKAGLSGEDAYMLCSLAADMRVTQIVNGCKGIHMRIQKDYLRSFEESKSVLP